MPLIDFSGVEEVVVSGLDHVYPAAQLAVYYHDEPIFSASYGWLDPELRQRPTQSDTQFDLASVSKLYTVTTFMALVEAGLIGLDQPVCAVLPEMDETRPIHPYEDPLSPGDWVHIGADPPASSVDASLVTFRHLLSHNSGLPAWRPLHREPDAEAARRMALNTFFSYPVGTRVVYSDVGLILLGYAIERVTSLPLDDAIDRYVLGPLNLTRTRYMRLADPLRHPSDAPRNAAPTEVCSWRGRRIIGEVHDENAARLGGVAGHAGLFSTADEVARFGQAFFHVDVLHAATISEMARVQAQDGDTRRGLGFALWSPDPESSGNPFGPDAFGHTGFTGTSLWIDPRRRLVVAALTNRVYYGRHAGGILEFRVALHRAIVEALGA
jgi:CubicO group peptidase (beta-lactamase class C family)